MFERNSFRTDATKYVDVVSDGKFNIHITLLTVLPQRQLKRQVRQALGVR